MSIVLVVEQPEAFNPVTVYVLVTDGVTDIVVVVNDPGAQVYDVPPLAVNVELNPEHNVADDATILIVGFAYTIKFTVLVLVQPKVLVPVTVYIVVAVGLTATGVPVIPPGAQV